MPPAQPQAAHTRLQCCLRLWRPVQTRRRCNSARACCFRCRSRCYWSILGCRHWRQALLLYLHAPSLQLKQACAGHWRAAAHCWARLHPPCRGWTAGCASAAVGYLATRLLAGRCHPGSCSTGQNCQPVPGWRPAGQQRHGWPHVHRPVGAAGTTGSQVSNASAQGMPPPTSARIISSCTPALLHPATH